MDYYKFKAELGKRCHSENSQRIAETHSLRLFYTLNLIKVLIRKDKFINQVNLLDIGSFLPFTQLYNESIRETGKKVCMAVVELPVNEKHQQHLELENPEIQFIFCNVEENLIPLESNSFDIILMCEILEHFTLNPFYALSQAHRLLKLGGVLILSTPNVASLTKRIRLMRGGNIYDTYSNEGIYGCYGRHNREYTVNEVKDLLRNSGFEVIKCSSRSFYSYERAVSLRREFLRRGYRRLEKFSTKVDLDIGDVIFCRAKKIEKEGLKPPNWLYRNSKSLQSMLK